jgi:hypothetical protein
MGVSPVMPCSKTCALLVPQVQDRGADITEATGTNDLQMVLEAAGLLVR